LQEILITLSEGFALFTLCGAVCRRPIHTLFEVLILAIGWTTRNINIGFTGKVVVTQLGVPIGVRMTVVLLPLV
jgi:hypothetical protein